MSEGKFPFESAPDVQNAFSNSAQEKIEQQENIQQNVVENEEYEELVPALTPDGFGQSRDAMHYVAAENAQHNLLNIEQEFRDNPTETQVSLREAWEKAQLHENSFDEGAEK